MSLDLSQLSFHIQSCNYIDFLKQYLQYISDGYNLAIPKSLKKELVIQKWKEILDELTLQYTDEFILKLTIFWLNLVNQNPVVSDNFITTLIDNIDNKNVKSQLKHKGHNDTVISSISDNYQIEKKVHDNIPKNSKQIHTGLHNAIKSNKPMDFLIFYLSLIRFQEKIPLPLSTVKNNILTKWTQIIFTQLKLSPTDGFLNELSDIWFQLMNKYGIPVSIQDGLKLYHSLLPELKKEKPKTKKKEEIRSPFWKELFGLK